MRSVRPLACVLGVALTAVCVAAVSARQTVFRSTVDVIAVDVQVVDSDGNPIGRIGPESFQVSINGQRRKVVSAQFIGMQPTSDDPSEPRPPEGRGRTFVLAVDAGSFEVGSERAPIEGAQNFVQHLDASDRVGLFVYPPGTQIAPTTQRTAINISLGRVTGQKDPLRTHYNLRPWEIVDITAQMSNPSSFLTAARTAQNASADGGTTVELDPVLKIQSRECPEDPDCPSKIYAEGMQLATQIERQVETSLTGLEALLRALEKIPGRKAVVLVSAGLLVSDRSAGRPDVGDMARIMGQTAARANASVYTVHIDTTPGVGPASQKAPGSSELARDRSLHGNWLSDFSQSAGGRLIYVPVGTANFAFDRILRETSAYYLLGVEPAPADRDGRPRKLDVKVKRRGVSVRSRQWVVIPPKG
ncbi:MAG: VWA domain-containing protein [Acidobacteria bacterium]|nr:VWA domain-containing protein [Acidobacteriota bacterium]